MSCEEGSSEHVSTSTKWETNVRAVDCMTKKNKTKTETVKPQCFQFHFQYVSLVFVTVKLAYWKRLVSLLLWLQMKVKLNFPTVLLHCSCCYDFNSIATTKQTAEHSHTVSSVLYVPQCPQHQNEINSYPACKTTYTLRLPVFAWFLL